MTIRPPYMFQRVETVPNLLKIYSEDLISRDQLLDAFLHRVNWEYRGITGDNDWKSENTWATVWEANRKGVISSADYMFLVSQYEVNMAGVDNV